jgi:D-lactate dehydrogenase (cytochrome)
VSIDPRYLSDAAHFPGGSAAALALPRTIADVRAAIAAADAVLPVGAQSSLTGGATPFGETLLSTEKLHRILEMGGDTITVEAGVPVATIEESLAGERRWFPPAPTFTGAFAGGIVATNAAGAATFKYGSVREWVVGLTIVLADGSVLDLRRGEQTAAGGVLQVPAGRGITVSVPGYRMPEVAKRSAGYFAADGMDLVDLFIGSEGTLGVIVGVTFRTAPRRFEPALALVPCSSERQALMLVGDLRDAARAAWRDPAAGIDVAAIEHMDRRCLDILIEDGADRTHDVRIDPSAELLLLVQLELPEGTTEADAFEDIASASSQGPIARFCRLLESYNAFDAAEIALPGQSRRAAQFIAVREAVPAGVNARVGRAQRDVDPRIAKTAADMVAPFERFGEMMTVYRNGFARRGLDAAIWGHISDGNVHPNVLPRSYEDVEQGKAAILEFGRAVRELGGCPLAEHGVGRNPVKQALLRDLYGEAGIEQMRAVKRALDPGWKLAPGVIFPPPAR